MFEDAPGLGVGADAILHAVALNVVRASYTALLENPPAGVSAGDLVGWKARHWDATIQRLSAEWQPWASKIEGRLAGHVPPAVDLSEAWTVPERTEANLVAMELAARGGPYSETERRQLLRYSGWGGLSIKRTMPRFPAGFPTPETRGLIHEYYTSTPMAEAIAQAVAPFVAELHRARRGEPVRALEPSCGIGRFLRAFAHEDVRVDWQAVEYSKVSAALLAAAWPDVPLHRGSFESFAARLPWDSPTYDLVIANPPYGPRGASKSVDQVGTKIRAAYHYFVWRTLGLLQPGGIGVFIVPGGLLTGATGPLRKLRATVLQHAHLMDAFRMPTESPSGREPLFPGANLVVDVVFLRRRNGPLKAPHDDDKAILDGRWFLDHPTKILGREEGKDDGDTATGKRRSRWDYKIIGDFEGLPALEERTPIHHGEVVAKKASTKLRAAGRGSVAAADRLLDHVPSATLEGLDLAALQWAESLGLRVRGFLRRAAADEDVSGGWDELVSDLRAWVGSHGAPHRFAGLRSLAAAEKVTGLQSLLTVFGPDGSLTGALARKPVVQQQYGGATDLPSVAMWLYRQGGRVPLAAGQIASTWSRVNGRPSSTVVPVEGPLSAAEWCRHPTPKGDQWMPRDDYVTGDLWPRIDALDSAVAAEEPWAIRQRDWLMRSLQPVMWEDLVGEPVNVDDLRKSRVLTLDYKPTGTTPRDTWVPIELVNGWWQSRRGSGWRRREMVRKPGLVSVLYKGGVVAYKQIPNRKEDQDDHPMMEGQQFDFIGYMNHDKALFRPKRQKVVDPRTGKPVLESYDSSRLLQARRWTAEFQEWIRDNADSREALADAYNRVVLGYVPKVYTSDPVEVERWAPDAPDLYPYQAKASNQLLDNRRGLLGFDVGLGKTYTLIKTLARARQEGWARRPVICVPNSIVWKWWRDFARVLPDYRVVVIGSKRKRLTRGARKGKFTAVLDTAEERAQKWAMLQAGACDVVLVTHSMIGRTKLDEQVLSSHAGEVAALRRAIAMHHERKKKAKTSKTTPPKGKSERKKAVDEEASIGWVVGMVQANQGQDYDPGITWEDVGVDFLALDESQNMKGLFWLEPREGGVPEGLGSTNPSKRAWHFAFRAWSVQRKTGGSGVFLLSATPAKNSPVEFYNAIALVDRGAWQRVGIDNPEAFADRYLGMDVRQVLDTKGKLREKAAVTHFTNLDELRRLIFRFAEFRTAEEVGLRIPDAENDNVFVDLTDEQTAMVKKVFADIIELEDEIKRLSARRDDPAVRARINYLRDQILAHGQRIDRIAIHPDLVRFTSKDPLKKIRAVTTKGRAPKLEQCVDAIMQTSFTACRTDATTQCCFDCGHIVFAESPVVHEWLRGLLIERGVPPARIAVLNAKRAKDPETRQQIAEGFNGVGCPSEEEYAAPKYDVVIANAVAYEGIDLQRRTCAIHHLDVPWEPATLQQRNGRGVRQGNTFGSVRISYYLAKASLDPRRLSKIDAKASWMSSLVSGQARTTNNPAAGSNMTLADLFEALASPEQRERLAELKRAEAARQKLERIESARVTAVGLVRRANQRFRAAERSHTPAMAARLRDEGELLVKSLARVEADVWPWFPIASKVRETAVFVPPKGPPLVEGLRLRLGGRTLEVGRIPGDGNSTFKPGVPKARPRLDPAAFRDRLSMSANRYGPVRVELLEAVAPSDIIDDEEWARKVDDPAGFARKVAAGDVFRSHNPHSWESMWWLHGSWAFREAVWPELADVVHEWIHTAVRLARGSHLLGTIPWLVRGKLHLVNQTDPPTLQVVEAGKAIPPTLAGWRTFLSKLPEARARKPADRLKVRGLKLCATRWWGLSIPPDAMKADDA